MNRLIPYIFPVILCQVLLAQEPADSEIVRMEITDLRFHSNLEYKVFDEFEDGQVDFLNMILAANPENDEDALAQYREWIGVIAGKISGGLLFDRISEERKIAAVQEYLRGNLLLTYHQDSRFENLVYSGTYNYITAPCLYALVLNALNIPFAVKESADYIYLIAFPKTGRFVIETAIPEFRYRLFDQLTRASFVNYLHDRGVIDDFTFRSRTTKELFVKYFFPREDLTLPGLAALQYMAQAMEDIQKGKGDQAFFNLQKAYYLHPSYKVQFLLLAQLNSFVGDLDLKTVTGLSYLAASARYVTIGFRPDFFLKRFVDIRSLYPTEEEQFDQFEKAYHFLMDRVDNPYLKKNMTFLYHYDMAIQLDQAGHYEDALDNLERAFDYREMNEEMEDLFIKVLADYAMNNSVADLIPRLEFYDREYSITRHRDVYLLIEQNAILKYFGESFRVGDARAGEQYRAEFEQLYAEHPDTGIDHDLMARSYAAAADFYLHKGDASRSEQVLRKGLELAPGNKQLLRKLDSPDH